MISKKIAIGLALLNVFLLSAQTEFNKLDANGNLLWVKQFGGTGFDSSYSITLDAAGNIYTCGAFAQTADFNPGAGIFNLTAVGVFDVFISKLDLDGNFIWAKQSGGVNSDRGYGITVDINNNVYTTGYFGGTADFDPGTGTFNLTSAGLSDVFVSKLDANGNFLWAKQFGGAATEIGSAIAVDAAGNVYITGQFSGTTDLMNESKSANPSSCNMVASCSAEGPMWRDSKFSCVLMKIHLKYLIKSVETFNQLISDQ